MEAANEGAAKVSYDESRPEAFNKVHQVRPRLWTLASRSSFGPISFVQRGIIMQLKEGDGESGSDVLFLINPMTEKDCPDGFEQLRALEQETGAKLRYIASNSQYHHLALRPWMAAFPEATILIPGSRIPHTKNGAQLVAEGGERVQRFVSGAAGEQLPQLSAELGCVLLEGWQSKGEGVFAEKLGGDEVLFYHKPSRTVIVGDSLSIWMPAQKWSWWMGAVHLFEKERIFCYVGDPLQDKELWRKGLEAARQWEPDLYLQLHTPMNWNPSGNGITQQYHRCLDELIEKSK